MRLRLLVAFVLALASGCGPKGPGPTTGPTGPTPGASTVGAAVPIPDGPPCPAAAAVMVAVVHEPTPGAPARWHLPLANRPSTETKASYRVLDAAAAAAAGTPTPPGKLWLMVRGKLCEAKPGAYYSDLVVDNIPDEILGVQLDTTCPLPSAEEPQQAIALVAEAAPTGCVAILPRPVAGRVPEEKDGTWRVLPESTPLPAPLAAALPQKPCAAPCEALWTASQLDFGGKPIAWDAAIEWLRVDAAQPDACQWASERDGGVFAANADGTAARIVDNHAVVPLHLGALLADRSGAKVLVLEHLGEYATFDVAAGFAKPARYLRWFSPDQEVYGGDRKLGPYCGP